ncbi:NAD(P)H-dependent glycerol-3-phosphate dehydrogenase [uncultured Mailhella sp.]|uniref:NAD(P)H-dependent glycerol-3-phosphate dehydrogenase n=1 Tax=uncultured Mailhella sp. TaxID=1981031 RepID=UPI0025D4C590|nr:NAD(P)H-dependent glycerol-3-phosphate dehydrogenase [uncultured Mailhella sp.]
MTAENTLRVVVAGGGSWGTALAHVLASAGHDTTLVLRDEFVAQAVNERHENPRYLPGKPVHPGVKASTSPEALRDVDALVLAVPCQHQRSWLASMRHVIPEGCVVVNASKGLENGTSLTMSHVVQEELSALRPRYAVLSGPSFAAEVMDGQPTAVVLGCEDETLGARLRELFSTSFFRCYSSTDVTGVETGGALKNVMAIAAGIGDGLGFGSNARAALITRGLAELSRLGTAMGARPLTFMGLSGLGDLVLTCTGGLSRNRQVGIRLGRGEKLGDIVASLGMVAEGVKTAVAARDLAQRLRVSVPVTEAMCRVLHENADPAEAVRSLMERPLREE